MFVLGIDPSLTESGIIGLRNGSIELSHLIKTKRTGDTPMLELDRLETIVNEIIFIADKYKPDAIVIEGMAFMARNTTALLQLSGLNYMMRHYLFPKYKTFIVPPTTLKKFITGKGNSPKEMMLLEVYKRYKKSFDNNNTCDAFCLAKLGEALINKDDPKLTKAQTEVVSLINKQYE